MQFVFRNNGEAPSKARARIRAACRGDESDAVRALLDEAVLSAADARCVERLAREFVAHVRATRRDASAIDSFLHEYDLSTQEGVTLMCLAESLLRVPDSETAYVAPRDPLEQMLANLWVDVLGRARWACSIASSSSAATQFT